MNTWNHILKAFQATDRGQELNGYLKQELKENEIYPPDDQWYRALELTPFDQVKVVILGQDPYHGFGQANGLAFSVHRDIPLPPSLRNIYKELENDIQVPTAKHGDLSQWAKQGVLLLNTVLTVRKGEAHSHAKHGWEDLTDLLIQTLSQEREGLVFILWGKHAQNKRQLIDATKHHIIESAHPSPLSAYRGFFGSKPFSKVNNFLEKNKQPIIDWQIHN